MPCDSGTGTPKPEAADDNKSNDIQHRIPQCFFLGSHEDTVGELTLDPATLKEVWGNEPVTLALASMLKAVLEGRVSSESIAELQEGKGDESNVIKDPPATDDILEARLALVEVFECFSAGLAPEARPIHILDIESLLARKNELSEARKTLSANAVPTGGDKSTDGKDDDDDEVAASVSPSEGLEEPEKMTAEEEMLSVLLKLVSGRQGPSDKSDEAEKDDRALTFGIVDSDLPSCTKNFFDKEWLLVCRETKKPKSSEDGVYPIKSIYSFFLVLNSENLVQAQHSPSSDSPSEQDVGEIASSTPEAKDTPDTSASDKSVFPPGSA